MNTDIEHTTEFPPRPEGLPSTASWHGDKERLAAEKARNLAAAYSRLFASDDGHRVLADLKAKFSPLRPRFGALNAPHSDPLRAARIDGQSDVMRDILDAIETGSSRTGIPSTQPTP